MDETNSSDLDNYNSLEHWQSRPPEELLEAFINELRSPFASIKGWIEIMRSTDSKEVHSKALEVIPQIIEKIEKEQDFVLKYLAEFKRKSSP